MAKITSPRFAFPFLLLAFAPVVIQASSEGDAFLRAARKIEFRTLKENHRREVDLQCDKWKCSNGATPKQNPSYKPVSNGCGTYGVSVQFMNDLPTVKACCNKHDLCYDTCGEEHSQCDNDLHDCIDNFCKREYANDWWKRMACRSMAESAKLATQSLGCVAFYSAQEKACKC